MGVALVIAALVVCAGYAGYRVGRDIMRAEIRVALNRSEDIAAMVRRHD